MALATSALAFLAGNGGTATEMVPSIFALPSFVGSTGLVALWAKLLRHSPTAALRNERSQGTNAAAAIIEGETRHGIDSKPAPYRAWVAAAALWVAAIAILIYGTPVLWAAIPGFIGVALVAGIELPLSRVLLATAVGLLAWPMAYQAYGVPTAWVISAGVIREPDSRAWWVRIAVLVVLTRLASNVAGYLVSSDVLVIRAATSYMALTPFAIVAGDRATAWWLRRQSGTRSDQSSTESTTS